MAVEIPVSANTSQIEAAIKRLEAAFANLNRAGKRFSEIDLSQATGRLKEDLETVRKNFEALSDPSRGRQFAKGLKASGQAGRDPWDWDFQAMYPRANERQLQAYREQAMRSLLHGTQAFGPLGGAAAGPSWPAPGRGRDDEHTQSLIGGLLGRLRGTLGRVAGVAGGIAGGLGVPLGLGAATVTGVMGAYRQYREVDELFRRTKDVGHSFTFLRDRINEVGKGFGVSADKAAELTSTFAKTAQSITATEALTGTRTGIGLAYGMGMDREQTVAGMAHLQLLGAMGTGGDLDQKQKRFAVLIGQTAARGGVQGDKVLGDLSRSVEAFSQATLQAPPMREIAGIWQALYETARDQGNPRPGLLGSGGQSLMSAVESGFLARAESEDPAIAYEVFRALSGPLGTENPLRIRQQMERGPWAGIGQSGTTNLSAIVESLRAHYGGQDPLAPARAMVGLFPGVGTLDRAQALFDMNDRFRGARGMADFGDTLSRLGVDWKTLDVSAIKDLADLIAEPGMANVKRKYRDWQPHSRVSESERAELDRLEARAGMGNAQDDQAFYERFMQSVARHGAAATPYTGMETLLTDLKDALIVNVGQPLLDNLPVISQTAQDILDWLQASDGAGAPSGIGPNRINLARGELSASLQNALNNPRAPDFEQRINQFVEQYKGYAGIHGTEPFADIRRRLAPNWANWLVEPDAARIRERLDIELGRLGLQGGGPVPGYGGGDVVPARLEPGEFVVNKQAAAAHAGLLRNINRPGGAGHSLGPIYQLAVERGLIPPGRFMRPEWGIPSPGGFTMPSPSPGGFTMPSSPHGSPRDDITIPASPNTTEIVGKPIQGQAEFIGRILPAAQGVAAELGIPPEYIVGQAALESNWGKNVPRAPGLYSHNLFGIKKGEGWTGPVVHNVTGEQTASGQRYKTVSPFRAYGSYEEGLQGYLSFLRNNPRYRRALEVARTGDGEGFIRELRRAGYATDVNYPNLVMQRVKQVQKYTDLGGFPAMPPRAPAEYAGAGPGAGPGGPSALDITVHLQDAQGAPVAAPVHSRVDLRQPRTLGSVHIQQQNRGGW